MYWRLYIKQPFFIWVKTDQGRMRCDVDSLEVFHIIDSINIQLGPNCQQSTTKMAVAWLRCDADSSEVFHIIDSINIQIGPNWQQSTTKMAYGLTTKIGRASCSQSV